MGHRHLLVRAVLLALVGALLAALSPGPGPAAAADECEGDLGRVVTKVWEGQRAEGGSVCAVLTANEYSSLRFLQPHGEARVPLDVYAGDGQLVCQVGGAPYTCDLDGPSPYRVVVPPGPPQDFHVAGSDLTTPRGCAPLEPGQFGTREGVDVTFDGAVFAACFTILTAELEKSPSIFAYERTAGAGNADLIVRGAALGYYGHECAATGTDGVGSEVCVGRDDTGYWTSVLLVSDGSDSTYRLVRRVPTATSDCPAVTSTEIGGPVTTVTPTSFVALECRSIEAAPTDRFAVDVHDATGAIGVDAFTPDGGYRCLATEPRCELSRDDRYLVVARGTAPAAAGGGGYELEPWQVADIHGWSPECQQYDDYDAGFGPVRGTLSPASSGACVLVDARGAWYTVDVGAASPAPLLRVVNGEWSSTVARCDEEGDGRYLCRSFDSPLNTGLLLLSRPDGVATMDYDVSGTCRWEDACDLEPPLEPVVEPVVTGRHVGGETLTVSEGTWEPETPLGYEYQWLVDGRPLYEGRGQQLRLTGDMVGHDVSVRVVTRDSWYESTVVVTEPRTVRSPNVERPQVLGTPQVGEQLRVDPGTWRSEPDDFRYAWFAGERRLEGDGRRLTLRRRCLGERIAVRVVAIRGDVEIGSATARSPRVRGR